jgi:hypothetical protein
VVVTTSLISTLGVEPAIVAGAATPGTSTEAPPASATQLRAAARNWAKAFLTGMPGGIKRMQGPECRSPADTTYSPRFLAKYLLALRTVIAKHVGRPLGKIWEGSRWWKNRPPRAG